MSHSIFIPKVFAQARQRLGVRWQRCKAQTCIGDTAFEAVKEVLRPHNTVRLTKAVSRLRLPPHSKSWRGPRILHDQGIR